MCKKLLITFSFALGLILAGLGLAHSGTGIVDKIELSSFEPVEKIEKGEKIDLPEVASYYRPYVSYTRTVWATTNTGYGAANSAGNYISVAGRNISVIDVDSTTVNAGNHVNRYGSKFYYGHNSAGVFGGLSSLGVGSSFSINYGGVLHNYRVAKIMLFEKNTSNGRLQLDGSGNYMRSVTEVRIAGVRYDVSLMTCAGTSYGNGDASHRLVIFANEY